MGYTRYVRFALVIAATAVSHVVGRAQTAHEPAADVFKRAALALAKVESVAFDARQIDGYVFGATRRPGHTHVLATRSPFRYSARLQTDDGARKEMAVSDGTTARASDEGKAHEGIARALMNTAASDAVTPGSLFDREFYAKALSSGDLLYAGRDDVDGELCDVVAYATYMADEAGGDTRYVWISTKTGLPRSYQAWRLIRGKTLLTVRWIIANVELNPAIPEGTFTYRPTAEDSTAAVSEPSKPVSAKVIDGVMAPDIPVRDQAYKQLSLASLKGKATILTFWAPWCGPCIAEMPIFKKLQDAYGGQLQIVALAVKDSRLNIDEWIAKNPQYGFRFLIDAELGRSPTPIESFFEIEGIPVNVFINSDGRIIAHWAGSDNEAALTAKVKALMGR